MPNEPCAAAPNPAGALWLQSMRPAGRVAELGALGSAAHAHASIESVSDFH
jgi:hypothetical protein